jgi:LAGLIDADG endonuclease
MVCYKVRNLDEIIKIIVPHFEKYPLITQKQSDFILFNNIIELMSKGEHLNKSGLTKIISLKASLNKGLSDKLKIYFPNVIKVKRPEVDILLNIDYNWVAGFFTGEGCFYINIYKSKNHKLGYTLMLQIIIGQHIRDKLLINSLINILGCGKISEPINRYMVILRISKFQDIHSKIIPLLAKYKIKGIKSLDFEDFCKVAELVNKGVHLTTEGLEKIRIIKSGMNKSRVHTFIMMPYFVD